MPYPGIPQFYTPPAVPRDPNSGFGQNFLKSFMAGLQERRAREAQAAEMEERKERLKHLKHLIKTAEMEEKQKELYGRPFDTFESLQKIVEKGGGPRVSTGGPVTSEADTGVPSFATSLTGEPSAAPPLTMPATAPIPQSVETRFPGIPFGEQGAELQVPTQRETLEQQLAALAAEARAKRVPPTMLPTPPGAAGALGPEVPENALPGILQALTPRAPEPNIDVGPIPGVTPGGTMTADELRARTSAYGTRSAAAAAAAARAAAASTRERKDWKAETDANGLFTGRQYNSSGEVREVPGLAGLRGKPLSGQAASRVHQAGVILDQGQKLIDELPAVAAKLGPVKGRAFKLTKLWGDPDPQVRKFAVELSSFVALQPALHGFRGLNALQEFEKIVGGTEQTPESLAAAIQGIMELGQTVYESGNAKKPGGRFTIIKVE